MRIELISSVEEEVKVWEERKGRMMERARVDFDLLLDMVEDYYDMRRPEAGRVVFEWEVNSVGGFSPVNLSRLLEGFKIVSAQYPNAVIKVI